MNIPFARGLGLCLSLGLFSPSTCESSDASSSTSPKVATPAAADAEAKPEAKPDTEDTQLGPDTKQPDAPAARPEATKFEFALLHTHELLKSEQRSADRLKKSVAASGVEQAPERGSDAHAAISS